MVSGLKCVMVKNAVLLITHIVNVIAIPKDKYQNDDIISCQTHFKECYLL